LRSIRAAEGFDHTINHPPERPGEREQQNAKQENPRH
jgi:hypothetical protein